MSVYKNFLSFIRMVLAVVVGIFIYSGILFVIFGIVVGVVASSATTMLSSHTQDTGFEGEIPKKAILKLNVGRLTEQDYMSEDVDEEELIGHFFEQFSEKKSSSYFPPGVLGLSYVIRAAGKDDRIKGISLDFKGFSGGMAQMDEVREALIDFKRSGKFIYTYLNYMTEARYYLASLSDTLMMYPHGGVAYDGFMARFVYFGKLMEHIMVRPVVFRIGKYKSAPNLLTETRLSEADKEQYGVLLDNLYDHYIAELAKGDFLSADKLRQLAESLHVIDGKTAFEEGMINALGYGDDYDTLLRKRISFKKKKKKLPYVSFKHYKGTLFSKLREKNREKSSKRIAVLIGEGEIREGEDGEAGVIYDKPFVKKLRRVAKSKKIKAVVLRINSPGGSFVASDKIWREIRAVAAKKPVIASLSSVAASGGYYLAMGCSQVVSSPVTITGSIGIFTVFVEPKKLMNFVGISEDAIKTHPEADASPYGQPEFTLSKKQRELIQRSVEDIYGVFIEKAAETRGVSVDSIDKVAQGRVWSGRDALGKSLVDTLGGFDVALALAAAAAGGELDDYSVSYWQTKTDIRLSQIIRQSIQANDELSGLSSSLVRPLLGILSAVGQQTRVSSFQPKRSLSTPNYPAVSFGDGPVQEIFARLPHDFHIE